MTPPIRWAARLYPASWRRRYGAEFSALLDDVRPGWRDFFDILRGAILMQLKLPGSGKIVAALAAAGLIVAAVVALRAEDRWVSTAVLQIQPENPGDRWAAFYNLNRAQTEVLSRSSLTQIVLKEDIYKKERSTLPLEDIIQSMRDHALMVRMITPTDNREQTGTAFSVSFEYPDRYKARAVANDVTAAFEEEVGRSSGPSLKLLDPPNLPQMPAGPSRAGMIAAGLAIGLATGVVILGIRRWPVVAACGIVAAALAWAGSQLVPSQYISTAVMTVPDEDTAGRIAQDLTSRTYLTSLIEKMHLYPQERQKEPLEEIVATMRNRAVKIQYVNVPQRPPAVAISYMSEDSKFTAQAVTREFVVGAMEIGTRSASNGPTLVLDPASLPARPVSPDRSAWVMSGLFAGLLLGTTWAVIRHFRTPAAAAHA